MQFLFHRLLFIFIFEIFCHIEEIIFVLLTLCNTIDVVVFSLSKSKHHSCILHIFRNVFIHKHVTKYNRWEQLGCTNEHTFSINTMW